MEWLWAGQIAVNMLVLMGMLLWWYERKTQSPGAMHRRIHKQMTVWENRVVEAELSARERDRRLEQHVETFDVICKQAKQLVQRGREALHQRVPSLEEQDLMQALGKKNDVASNSEAKASADPVSGSLKSVFREQML